MLSTRSPFDDASGQDLLRWLAEQDRKSYAASRYLIQFGGDKNTNYCRTNAQLMETSGAFDGTVINTSVIDSVLGLINTVNSVCRVHAQTWDTYAIALADMQVANFKRFTQNFTRANVGSRQSVGSVLINPFVQAEFDIYINNIGIFARFAKESGCIGLLLDTEKYNGSIFWGPYSSLDQAHTYPEWQAKYKELGFAAMRKIIEEFPGCFIALAVSYEQVAIHGTNPPEEYAYALQPSFLDGMHDAASPPTKLYNIMEEAYSNQTAADMAYDISYQTRAVLGSVLGSPNYERVHENGLTTWIDYPGSGFNFTNVALNYNTPAQFKTNILLAAQYVPRYVFIYSQQVVWWGGTINVSQVPSPYQEALAEARASL